MAVTTSVDMATGLFVPWRTAKRGGVDGGDPVGTLSLDASATGAAGGGTVTLTITAVDGSFGFHAIWVPTYIALQDNLAAAESPLFSWRAAGNARLDVNLFQTFLSIRGAGTDDVSVMQNATVPIEPDNRTATQVMQAIWATNTDTIVYHIHTFGVLFDAELLARAGRIPDILAGVR